jgi:hypothetical protein
MIAAIELFSAKHLLQWSIAIAILQSTVLLGSVGLVLGVARKWNINSEENNHGEN